MRYLRTFVAVAALMALFILNPSASFAQGGPTATPVPSTPITQPTIVPAVGLPSSVTPPQEYEISDLTLVLSDVDLPGEYIVGITSFAQSSTTVTMTLEVSAGEVLVMSNVATGQYSRYSDKDKAVDIFTFDSANTPVGVQIAVRGTYTLTLTSDKVGYTLSVQDLGAAMAPGVVITRGNTAGELNDVNPLGAVIVSQEMNSVSASEMPSIVFIGAVLFVGVLLLVAGWYSLFGRRPKVE